MNFPKTILIVDDSNEIRESLGDFLVICGFTVESANSGASALEFIKSRYFDVIITDCDMPEIDGLEFTHAARRQCPKSMIIGMSAHQKEKEFVEAGADAFLAKPFFYNTLLPIIQSAKHDNPV